MLKTNVKHWIVIKPTHFTVELLLVSQKQHVICNHTYLAQKSVYLKNIDYLKKSRLKSLKIALNQRNVQNSNETKPFYQWITTSFSEEACYMQSH